MFDPNRLSNDAARLSRIRTAVLNHAMRTFVESPERSGKAIPFNFVLDLLDRMEPVTRPMFGCTSVYVGEKIVLILRQKSEYQDDNGVWVATLEEHHGSLREQFPSLRNIRLFGGGTTGWQNLPMQAADFESSVERVCEMILAGDPRIGKIPAARKSKRKRAAKSRSKRTLKKSRRVTR